MLSNELTELSIARSATLAKLEALKSDLVMIERAILEKIDAVAIYDRHDKSYGDVTEEVAGHKVKLKIAKTVKWDSDKLLDVAKTMPWAEASKLFKIEFSMGEKEFNALEVGGPLMSRVREARTVKFSDPKIVSIE